jgi:hypothetical protein
LKSLWLASLLLVCWTQETRAQVAPAQLRDKSVNLSWTSTWVVKSVDRGRQSTSRTSEVVNFYFASTGRVFSRRAIDQHFTGGKKINADSIGNEEAASPMASYSQITFGQSSMEAVRKIGANAAIRITITFNEASDGCRAEARFAKAQAAVPSTYRSPDSGRWFEAISVTAGTVQCTMVNGNTFAR